jgi:hypothetical protein
MDSTSTNFRWSASTTTVLFDTNSKIQKQDQQLSSTPSTGSVVKSILKSTSASVSPSKSKKNVTFCNPTELFELPEMIRMAEKEALRPANLWM